MNCPACHHENPDDNRFCGNCGTKLINSIANDDGDHVRTKGLSTPLPPEVVEFDNNVPLIAAPGSDRRKQAPPEIKDKLHEALDSIESRWGDEDEAARRKRADVLAGLRHSPRVFKSEDPEPETPTAVRVDEYDRNHRNEYREATTPEPSNHSGYFDLTPNAPETTDTRTYESNYDSRTDVSGPSFLGLGGAPVYADIDDEEERPRHTRRYIALFVFLVLVGLVAVQWKTIRDTGLRYAEAGSMKIKVLKKGDAANNSAMSSAPNTPQGSGQSSPNIVVEEPNKDLKDAKTAEDQRNAQKQPDQNAPAQTAGTPNAAAQNNAPAAGPTTPTDSASNTTSQPSPDGKSTDAKTQPPAETKELASNDANSAPPKGTRRNENVPESDAADDASSTSDEGNTESVEVAANEEPPSTTRRAGSKPSASRRQEVAEPVLGRTELEQANKASDAETSAAWLWRATKKGNPDAPIRLAELYIAGRGVPKNCEQAMILLRSAADKRNARARSKLGALYATGQCVQQDRVQAYQWLSKALSVNPSSEWTSAFRQKLWSQMSEPERARAEGRPF